MRIVNFKRLGKKTMAAFLAFIMVFGYFAVFEGVLRADATPLSSNLTQNLVPAGLFDDPTPDPATGLPQGMIHLSFPISYTPGGTAAQNTFVLHFPMGNEAGDQIRQITVLLTSDTTAVVSYDSGVGAAPSFFVNRGVAPGAVANADFVQIGDLIANPPVYEDSDGNINIVDGFYDNRFYLDPEENNPNHWVDVTTPSTPSFGIEQGHGFSFAPVGGSNPNMNQANAVSFLWDGTDFRVVVGGMQQGRIYDFILAHDGQISTRSVFTGFLYEARPVARHREEPRDSNDQLFYLGGGYRPTWNIENPLPQMLERFPMGWTNWNLTEQPPGVPIHPLAHPDNILHHYNRVGPDNDWYPGGLSPHTESGVNTDNVLEFVIKVPQRVPRNASGFFSPLYSDDVFEYLTQAEAGAMFLSNTLVFNIAGPTGPSFGFNIRDIFGTTPVPGPPGIVGTQLDLHIRPLTSESNEVGILLDGPEPFSMPPSMLFTNSTLLLGGLSLPGAGTPHAVHDSWVTATTPMPLHGLHTFLNYNVVFIDGEFHVRIETFGVAGTYTLNFPILPPTLPQADAYVHAETGDEVVFIPLILNPNEEVIFNVIFDPFLHGVGPIHSQWMHFRATPDRMLRTAPGNFTVTPNHPDLRFILDEEGYAAFDIEAGWDIGFVGTLMDYFDLEFGPAGPDGNYIEGEIVFTYHIRYRDYPDQSDDVTSIAQADLVFIRNSDGSIEWWFRDIRFNPDMTTFSLVPDDGVVILPASDEVATGRDMIVRYHAGTDVTSVDWSVYVYEQNEDGEWVPVTVPATDLYYDEYDEGSLRLQVGTDEDMIGRRVRIVAEADPGTESYEVIINITDGRLTGAAGNRIPNNSALRNNMVRVNLPMSFVISSESPPLRFEGIYFLTNTLIRIYPPGVPFNPEYLHESNHNNNSFLSLSRPDRRELPPPYGLQVWTGGTGDRNIDPEDRLGGFFDMSFGVPWYEIDRYLNRSPFHNAGYQHQIMYRIFIGSRSDIDTISQNSGESIQQAGARRTAGIWGTTALGLVVPLNIANNWRIFPIIFDASENGDGGVVTPPEPPEPPTPPEPEPEPEPTPPQRLSTSEDFGFSGLDMDTTLGGFNVAPGYLTNDILDLIDPDKMTALNNDFREHVGYILGIDDEDDFEYWLYNLEYILSGADLDEAWSIIVNVTPWDAEEMGGIWDSQDYFDSTMELWNSIKEGFDFTPFLAEDTSGEPEEPPAINGESTEPPAINGARVLPRATIGYGVHNMVVNSLPQPFPVAPDNISVFDLSPWIEEFRAGPVVIEVPFNPPIGVVPADFQQTFSFEGLDHNWAYYVIVDSWIEFFEYDEDGNRVRVHANLLNPPSREYSNTTDIQGIVTYDPLPELDPGEIIPPAPQDLRVEEVTLNSGTISWLDVPPPTGNGRNEFEIARFRGTMALEDSLLGRRDQTMVQFIESLQASSRAGFEAGVRTDRTGGTLSLVNPPGMPIGGGTFDPNNTFGLSLASGGRLQLENTGLTPNTLYFYYVRTVWITYDDDGNPRGESFSSWMGVSLTTTIVEPPTNLRIVDHRAIPGLTINPQTQFIIRFEAPVGGLGTGNVAADHGSIFDFRFSLRSGTGQWQAPVLLPNTVSAGLLERHPTQNMPGYYTFTYLISGRSPGTTYQIRVHTFDVINSQPPGDAFGEAYSEWSNVATTRTDADQDYMDRERDRENLRIYLRDLLREFLRRPYWIALNQNSHFIAMYRPTMVDYLLQTNGQLIRLAHTNHPTSTFYLPQALFLQIWDGGQGFTIQRNDMTITIPNQAINSINSDPVLDTVRRIRDVSGVEDYYVRLIIDVRVHVAAQIQGEYVAGQQVTLNIDLVESNTNIRQLDESLMHTLLYAIESDFFIDRITGDRSFTFGQEIENMVAGGIAHLYQVRRMHEIAEIINHEMSAYVNTRLTSSYGRAVSFNFISQPVSITLTGSASNQLVGGFQFAANTWVRQSVEQQGTNRVIRTQTPGSFAFTRGTIVMPGLNTIVGHDRLMAIISNYGLTELLGVGDNFNLGANVSLNTVQGVVARLAGAPAGVNFQTWLRNQGYIVPVRGANAPAQTQEVVYTLMALYEMRTNTNVSSLRISNFNNLNNITGIDNRFRPYIQAAFELNILTNRNMQPTANMTNDQFLRLLLVLDQRIGL